MRGPRRVGNKMEIAAPCGRHVVFFPAALKDRPAAFATSCECNTFYLLTTEPDAVHIRRTGSMAEVGGLYEALPWQESQGIGGEAFFFKTAPSIGELRAYFARGANVADHVELVLNADARREVLQTATGVLGRGASLHDGIVVLFDLRHAPAFDILVALDHVLEPNGTDAGSARAKWKARAQGHQSLCAWLPVGPTADVLHALGLVDQAMRDRVIGPLSAGEFRVAVFGETTAVTTMSLPN